MVLFCALVINRALLFKILLGVLIFFVGALIGAVLVLLGFKGCGRKGGDKESKDKLIKEKVITAVKCGILDNLGVGIVAYDRNEDEPVYYNKFFSKFAEGDIPRNIDEFYKAYDNNEVESDRFNLLLKKRDALHNSDEIRYTFVRDDKIYEIKNLKVHNYRNEEIGKEIQETNNVGGIKLFEKMIEECNVFQIEDISNAPEHVKSQMDYSATLSHQLKTPITIITNTIEADKNIDRDSYEKIKRACQRVKETANAFTKFSQENFHFQTTPIRQCIEGAMERIEFYPGRDAVDIEINYEQPDLQIFCDVECIITVIQNLITNAIKYIDYEGKTEPHRIKINARTDENNRENAIVLEVSDNGRGIPKEDVGHVFEGFFRVDRSGSQKDGGTGLGLTIVEKMSQRHLGKVQVVSGVHSGSSFLVTLPTAKKILTDVYKTAKDNNESEKQIYKDAARVLSSQINYALETITIEQNQEYVAENSIIKLVSKIDDKQFEAILKEYLTIDSFGDEFGDFDEFDSEEEPDDLYTEEDLEQISEYNEGDRSRFDSANQNVQAAQSVPSSGSDYNPEVNQSMELTAESAEERIKTAAEEEKARNLELLREPVVQMVKRKQEFEAARIEEKQSQQVQSEEVQSSLVEISIKDSETEDEFEDSEVIQNKSGKKSKSSKENVMIHPEMKKSAIIKRNFFKNQDK